MYRHFYGRMGECVFETDAGRCMSLDVLSIICGYALEARRVGTIGLGHLRNPIDVRVFGDFRVAVKEYDNSVVVFAAPITDGSSQEEKPCFRIKDSRDISWMSPVGHDLAVVRNKTSELVWYDGKDGKRLRSMSTLKSTMSVFEAQGVLWVANDDNTIFDYEHQREIRITKHCTGGYSTCRWHAPSLDGKELYAHWGWGYLDVYDWNGVWRRSIHLEGDGYHREFAVDCANRIWAICSGRCCLFDQRTGQLIYQIGADVVSSAKDITVDTKGRLYVAGGYSNPCISVFEI